MKIVGHNLIVVVQNMRGRVRYSLPISHPPFNALQDLAPAEE